MAKKSFLEKAVNRKIGGMKRSAKASIKKSVKNKIVSEQESSDNKSCLILFIIIIVFCFLLYIFANLV